jgi:hypothetical protein
MQAGKEITPTQSLVSVQKSHLGQKFPVAQQAVEAVVFANLEQAAAAVLLIVVVVVVAAAALAGAGVPAAESALAGGRLGALAGGQGALAGEGGATTGEGALAGEGGATASCGPLASGRLAPTAAGSVATLVCRKAGRRGIRGWLANRHGRAVVAE